MNCTKEIQCLPIGVNELNSNALRHKNVAFGMYHVGLKMRCWTGNLKQWEERKSYLSSDLELGTVLGRKGKPRL